jgi:uracil-DNA glycosylase family 4
MDHEEEGFPNECSILFVSESFKMEFGELTPFTSKEEALIESAIEKAGFKHLLGSVEYTAAVKCPSVKDKDMSKDDKDICRQHIAKTIEKCKPSLIFVCGNLPMVMLTKKSGIMNKRGKIIDHYEGIPVVPIYNPTQVIVEPKNDYLFSLDIQNAIEQVLAHPELSKWEYILTIEHDNMPPSDGVLRLVDRMEAHPEFACIGGLYFTKGEGGVAQIWGDPKDPLVNFRPQVPDPNGGLVECCGTGMGFNLFRMSMFKDDRLRKPWFVTQRKDGVATQDLYFWGDARKYGYRCAIDCSVKVGHFDHQNDMVW